MKSSIGTPHIVKETVEFELGELSHLNRQDTTPVHFAVEIDLAELKRAAISLLMRASPDAPYKTELTLADGALTLRRVKTTGNMDNLEFSRLMLDKLIGG
jgi:hypothetical protein